MQQENEETMVFSATREYWPLVMLAICACLAIAVAFGTSEIRAQNEGNTNNAPPEQINTPTPTPDGNGGTAGGPNETDETDGHDENNPLDRPGMPAGLTEEDVEVAPWGSVAFEVITYTSENGRLDELSPIPQHTFYVESTDGDDQAGGNHRRPGQAEPQGREDYGESNAVLTGNATPQRFTVTGGNGPL